MKISTRQGSQHWLQVAVNDAPDVLLDALRPALELDSNATIEWHSPLESDDFREYRDEAALRQLEITLTNRPLSAFWPAKGPQWDAIGKTSNGQPIFVEAKAHVIEVNSPSTGATSEASRVLIRKSLEEAKQHFAPEFQGAWGGQFYQYANRLAHHYLFRTVNKLPSHMVFLYFLNASDMSGPKTQTEWSGAIELLHSALGLTQTDREGIHEVFLDVALLKGSPQA